jgi:hypothetical protein
MIDCSRLCSLHIDHYHRLACLIIFLYGYLNGIVNRIGQTDVGQVENQNEIGSVRYRDLLILNRNWLAF